MAAISETLRQARLRSGIDLDMLAAKTKINPRYLHAIEDGEFEKLPGGIFARMFIKQYADALGLDGASFAEEFQRSSPSSGYTAADSRNITQSRERFQPTVPAFNSGGDRVRADRVANMLSSLIWVLAAILVCAGAYYGLAHLPSRVSEGVAQTPPATKMEAPQHAVKPASATSAGSSEHAPQPAETQPSTPAATKTPEQPINIVLTATDEVWVTAVADGKTVISESLQPGTSKTVSAEKGTRITLGNAGGVEITFNGKKLEPFGPKGQVRTIDFTSFGAQLVSKTTAAAARPKAEPAANPDPLR